MRFTLVDLITELELGSRITTTKSVTLSEEYLDDHFPRFPVLPGVLMLEAMTQACAWLIRVTDDFSHSIVTLKEARNVKYARFVKPGETLTIKATLKKRVDRTTSFDVTGYVGEETALTGKLTLEYYNLAEKRPSMAQTDRELVEKLRQQLVVKLRGATVPAIA
jgi:3-hydroxyacyl-[acyl-carrier-protein] dehydratase